MTIGHPATRALRVIASFPDHAASADRLVRLADAALYLAKRSGRAPRSPRPTAMPAAPAVAPDDCSPCRTTSRP